VSVTAPKNTLLYQRKGRPLVMKRDIGSLPITEVSNKIKAFEAKWGEDFYPETEAIQFYLANHAMAELEFRFEPEEPLPVWATAICDEYHSSCSQIAARAFYYLLLITAREARHNHTKENMKATIAAKFGGPAAEMLQHYIDDNSVECVTNVFDNYGTGATLGQIAQSLVLTFYEGSFGSSFGGPAWGNVADCMTNFVLGRYSAEMMLDTVWTLQHNGGPIFNKSMLYECYDTYALQMVLDVQRAGQIPRLVLNQTGKLAAENFINEGARAFAKRVREAMPDSIFGDTRPVNFADVEALGALGSYASLIETVSPEKKKEPWTIVEPPYAKPKPNDKTHYVIANKPGMFFKKLHRSEI
jgi:hypothetical protein